MLREACMVSLIALSFGLIACGDEPPETPPPAPPEPTPAPSPTVVQPTPPTPAPANYTGPCDASMTLALKTAIEGREKSHLQASMKPEGAFRCEHVNEGGTVEVPVTLQPGRCYSFLAHSFPNVTEVNLLLKPNFGANPPPLLAGFKDQPLGEDTETGPAASIGSGSSCMNNQWPIPGPAMVVVTAKTGAGPIAVQVYSRAK